MFSISPVIRRATALAVGLTLMMSQTAAGVTWLTPVRISHSPSVGAAAKSTAVTGTQRVHVFYTETDSATPGAAYANYQRSGDGGQTWTERVGLGNPGALGSIAMAIKKFGLTTLDVVWSEFDDANHYRIWYRRSLNNGSDWDAPVRLTQLTGDAGNADVARAGDRVSMVYTGGGNGTIYVRTSPDGGETWAGPRGIGSTINQPYLGADSYDGFVSIADMSGTITVVWYSDDHTLRARRSTDGGATWRPITTLATNGNGLHTTLTPAAAKLIVGYTSAVGGYWRATERRSFDEGAHWTAAAPIGADGSFTPIFAYGGGVLRGVFYKCLVANCSQTSVQLITSTNFGNTWSAPSKVNGTNQVPRSYSVGVGPIGNGRTVVIYQYVNASDDSRLWSRTTN